MKLVKALLGIAALGLIGVALFVYLGIFNVAADEPHSKPVFKLMETVRERLIAERAKSIEVPLLDDPAMITSGGADYNEMCTGCHLKPGMDNSELRAAMYPQPPDLTKVKRADPAQTFWIIKHGIKMSAMPAWGATHDDQRMWAMVAFLQQLPRLTPAQYQILTARSEDDDGDAHGGMDMPGMVHEPNGHEGAKPAPAEGQGGHDESAASKDTAEAAVDCFLAALASGNAKAAENWLAPDVLVYESGDEESSRDEYAAHHLKADIEFLSKAKIERLERASNGGPDIAWVTSRVRIRAASDGKPLDLLSTETMVLTHQAEGWRIRHIHWSSASYKAGAS